MKFNAQPHIVLVEFGSHITTQASDNGWKTTGAHHIKTWHAAKDIFKEKTFRHRDEDITINVSWNEIVERVEKDYDIMKRLEIFKHDKAKYEKTLKEFTHEKIAIPFLIYCTEDTKAKPWYLENFISYYLHEIFLIMNIASPSSLDLYFCTIKSHDKRSDITIGLSNLRFETAILQKYDHGWPDVKFLAFEQVAQWYNSVRTEFKMIPCNRMEKLLFAILHISKSDPSPVAIIWIFYALETLFDTKVGENFRFLVSRIEILLDLNPDQAKILKKELRKIYDIRSAFVHGGLQVIHPMHNEILDREIDEHYFKYMEAVDFGHSIILASIQKIISNNWPEPKFKEILDIDSMDEN